MNQINPKYPVLIAEDNPNDVELLRLALKKAGVEHPLRIVGDGQEAVDYLAGRGKFADRSAYPFPDVILLDIKMPKMSGLEVLQWVKAHPECAVIPTVIFTASSQESDIKDAYQLGANGYLVKPSTFDELVRRIKLMFEFWSICMKPPLPVKCG